MTANVATATRETVRLSSETESALFGIAAEMQSPHCSRSAPRVSVVTLEARPWSGLIREGEMDVDHIERIADGVLTR